MIDKVFILNKIKSHYNFTTNAEFAKFLGISANLLGQWYRRNTIDYEVIGTKCTEINTNWLFGRGDMLYTNNTNPLIVNHGSNSHIVTNSPQALVSNNTQELVLVKLEALQNENESLKREAVLLREINEMLRKERK